MGRITIFSLKTCPHCKKAKALFEDKGWEFYEVSLTDYPEKRTDMLKLADRLTVPQVFFNTKHLGGAVEVERLDEAGTLDVLYKEMQNEGDPDEKLLDKPDYPPKEDEKVPDREEELICVGDQCLNYTQLNDQLLSYLEIKDRKYRLKTYRRCFVAKDLVDLILEKFPNIKTRGEAVQIGKTLQMSNMFDHVLRERDFEDKDLFFVLQTQREPKVLNTYRIWNDRVGKPQATLKALKKAISTCVEKHRSKDGLVDYKAVAADQDFVVFEEMVCELQKISLEEMTVDARTAFCINLYNMMIPHAFARVGAPKTNLQRMQFFDRIKYNVGGHDYSFNDIENGILRGNQVPPYHLSPLFRAGDPRKASSNPSKEPRIHFALNCGAKSCPPVKNFTEEAIREELRIVALSFMEQEENCRVDLSSKTLWLSKILSWYKADFGTTRREVAESVVEWLRGEKKEALQKMLDSKDAFKIRHFNYDWGNDAKA